MQNGLSVRQVEQMVKNIGVEKVRGAA